MERSEEFKAIAKAMAKIDFCMMQTVGDTEVNTRPMSNNGEVEYDGDNWFFSHRDSNKVREIAADNRVHLVFADNQDPSFIAVWGEGEIVDDDSLKEKFWHKELEQWFENGPQGPSVVLIKVSANKIQTWGRVGDLEFDLDTA